MNFSLHLASLEKGEAMSSLAHALQSVVVESAKELKK
jgi:hypothetical protein